LAGTTWAQLSVRKSTRLWLVPPDSNPTSRLDADVDSGSSEKRRSLHDTAAQVWKLLRIASYVASSGASGLPCASIWKLCPCVGHQMQGPWPLLFLERT